LSGRGRDLKLPGMVERLASFVAECFLPGVDEDTVRALDARASRAAETLTRAGRTVRYLGSVLMREDEVVLCQFEGTADAVRAAAEQAQIPFERILETIRSPVPVVETV
jgi:hypothetical protein